MTMPMLAKVDPETARRALVIGALAVRARHAAETVRSDGWSPLPYQVPPDTAGSWDVWVLMAGLGTGKTFAGAHAVCAHAQGPACLPGAVPHRIAIVSTTDGDAVDTCVRGETGLLAANPTIKFSPGARLAADLTWRNGAEAQLFGAFAPEDVERFRGPQHCLIWAKPPASG